MKWSYCPKIGMMLAGFAVGLTALTTLAMTIPADNVEEYILVVGNEELRFVARPELGYVIKARQNAASTEALDTTLKSVCAVNISPIGGSGRKGVSVVYSERSADENEKTVKLLRSRSAVQYAAPLFSSNGQTVAIIPEIVVRVTPDTEIEQVEAICKTAGCMINKRMEFTEQEYLIEVLGSDPKAVFTAVEQLNEKSFVEWACPNTAFQPKLSGQAAPHARVSYEPLEFDAAEQDPNSLGIFPNDEYFPKQWHLYNTGQSGGTPGVDIRAPEAWEITTGDSNIVVAEFGGYVDMNHRDLVNNLVPGYDFVQPGSSPVFDNLSAGHSTWCAGIVAAQGHNGIGVAGVTWNCKIMPIRIWEDRPLPTAHRNITEAERATAIRWAATNGADVLDCQWGYTTPQPTVHSAIADVTRSGGIGRNGKGCVVACSAPWYPGQYHEVIAVGSTDHNDNLFLGSYLEYHGPEMDIAAPDWVQLGEETKGGLWTTDVTGFLGYSSHPTHPDPNILDYSIADGATSIISGVAALILSIEPDLTSDEVRHFLEQSAKDLGDPGRDDYYGWGRVDARAALDMVLAARADLHRDGKVDFRDLAVLNAAIDTNDTSADIAPAAKRDGIVDEKDVELLMRYMGTEYPELGLIAHWRLDESEGLLAQDSAGNNDAVAFGGPLWQPAGGQVDGAIQLDGINDCVIIGSIANPTEGPFSILVWIKGGAPGQAVLSQIGGANWLLADPSEGNLMTELKSAGQDAAELLSQTIIADDNWHRIGLVWDGISRTLYVDGVAAAQDEQHDLDGSNNGLYIGCGKNMEPGTYWFGLIDDVRIYNRAVKP